MLLAYDGMNLLDLAGLLQALTTANRSAEAGAPSRYDAIVASARGGPVVTGSGLPVINADRQGSSQLLGSGHLFT